MERLSPRSCKESERMARLFVTTPPTTSTIVKARLRKKAVRIPAVDVDPLEWEWLMES
jgi:hypothetical protein